MDNGRAANCVTLGGREFKLGKLDVFKQFHVARKLSPLLLSLLDSAQRMRGALPGVDRDADLQTIAAKLDLAAILGLTPTLDVLAKMSQDDVDYILKTCLSTVEVKQGESLWAPLMAPGGELFMFPDIDMLTMIGLCVAAVRQDITSFFATAPRTSS